MKSKKQKKEWICTLCNTKLTAHEVLVGHQCQPIQPQEWETRLREEVGCIIANFGIQGEKHTMLSNVLIRLLAQERKKEREKTFDGLSKQDMERITVQSSIDQMKAHEQRIREEVLVEVANEIHKQFMGKGLDLEKLYEFLAKLKSSQKQ